MMISTFLFMPVYFYLMEKYGKRTTYLIGVLVRQYVPMYHAHCA